MKSFEKIKFVSQNCLKYFHVVMPSRCIIYLIYGNHHSSPFLLREARFKVSQDVFKQNKNLLKNKKLLLWYIISWYLLKLTKTSLFQYIWFTFFTPSEYRGNKVQTENWNKQIAIFLYFMSSCANRIAVFNNCTDK